MTQLFDTSSYDHTDSEGEADGPGPTGRTGRHLRSVAAPTDDFDGRRTDWRLDENTIEIGRRGIARAREALKDAAKGRPTPRRAA